jgi:hypothetical protein
MSQENYTIIPLMGVDQSGNVPLAPTVNTFAIGLGANPVAFSGANSTVLLTVPTPSNFVVGQTITISGGVGTIATVTAANYNITANITAIGTTTISYTAASAANAAASGGGTAMVLTASFSPTDYKPLERLACSDGTIRMLVKGTVATINANDCVIVDGNGNAQQMTTALVTQGQLTAGYTIGMAPYAITYSATTPNYGWIIVNGPCQVNVAGATALGTALFSSTTAGQVATSGNGGANPYLILGLQATTTSAGAGTVSAIATNLTIGQTAAGTL